jgi:hypothetical protein
MLPYYCRTSVRQQHTWHCPLEFERSTRFIHHAAYLSTASTTCGRFSPRTASRKDISCLEGTPMHDAANELRRIPLLGNSVNRGRAQREIGDLREPQRRIHRQFIAVLYAEIRMEPRRKRGNVQKGSNCQRSVRRSDTTSTMVGEQGCF